jgi:hypothetical protein
MEREGWGLESLSIANYVCGKVQNQRLPRRARSDAGVKGSEEEIIVNEIETHQQETHQQTSNSKTTYSRQHSGQQAPGSRKQTTDDR